MTRPPDAQPVRGFPHAVEHALEVDGDLAVEQRIVGVGDGREQHDAGIVHQHVDAAERLRGLVEQMLDRRRVGDVGAHGDGASTGILDLRRLSFGVRRAARVVDDDREAVLAQAFGDRGANAARRSGHDRCLARCLAVLLAVVGHGSSRCWRFHDAALGAAAHAGSRAAQRAGWSRSERPTRFSISLRTRSITAKATEAPSSVGSIWTRNGRLPKAACRRPSCSTRPRSAGLRRACAYAAGRPG